MTLAISQFSGLMFLVIDSNEAKARAALAECVALRIAETRVCGRVAFARALAAGRTFHEYDQSSQKAREEVAAVYELARGQPY